MCNNNIPSRNDAEALLSWAQILNPGSWIDHSKNSARAAETIANFCDLDSNKAYIMGLLHDIGRYEGITDLHHIVAGNRLLLSLGYSEVARICLTHSFPSKDINIYSGNNDCCEEEILYVNNELRGIEYDDYDKLIQLCDALSSPNGIVLIELRLMDVAKRRGLNDFTLEKWIAFDDLKNYFSLKCKNSIYNLFYDEVCKNSIR